MSGASGNVQLILNNVNYGKKTCVERGWRWRQDGQESCDSSWAAAKQGSLFVHMYQAPLPACRLDADLPGRF
jgi:hypothetical protein